MAQFVNATQARGEIERILTNAKYNIIMISPFIKINEELITRLIDAGNRKVKTLLVCRKEDLKVAEKSKIDQIKNLSIMFNERVHAKCFYNEDSMVITSLNLYDSSFGDNREMGILLRNDQKEDKSAFMEAKNEAQFIIRESLDGLSSIPKLKPREKTATKLPGADPNAVSRQNGDRDNKAGHCIACGKNINFDIEKPYCRNCYDSALEGIDDEYAPIENYCHACGKKSETTIDKPLCYSCYKKIIK